MSRAPHLTPSGKLLSEYNVLVLGETQSGKSTLIQYMRKYANPGIESSIKTLGTGFLSQTQEVTSSSIVTDLPEYCVADKNNGTLINYGKFVQERSDEHDYEDALNTRKGLETRKGDSRLAKKVKFNLIDTPGLSATGSDHESHVRKIFRSLNKAKAIHLLLITISSGPFTQGLKDAIRAYVDMFPGFNGIIAFVHTHFDYKNFHPARAQVSYAIDLRTESLYEIMGSTTFPHFKIDCDVYNKKPIRDCITQNTIQKILELATFNQPVDMLHTVINKTRKMRDIDNILRDKFEDTSATIEKTLKFKDAEEELLAQIFRNETTVHKLEARIKILKEFFISHNVDLLGILHEGRCHKKHKGDGQKKDKSLKSPSISNVTTPMAKSQKLKAEIGSKYHEYTKLKQELLALYRDRHAKRDKKRKQFKETVNAHIEGTQPLGTIANEDLPRVIKPPQRVNAHLGDMARGEKQAVNAQFLPTLEPDVHGDTNGLPGNQKYSVLVLGKTQSGKSTFIEYAKKYANPDYTINQAVLGNGTFSKTDRTHAIRAKSTLPSYEMYNKTSGNVVVVDSNPGDDVDEEDIQDMLYTRDDNIGLRLAPENLSSDAMEFEFLDTPGLCNHENKDVAQAADIISGILSKRYFNLILVVVSIQDPFSAEQLLALEYYSKVLDGLHSKIAILYTHADYGNYLHPNKAQQSALAKKTQTLSRIFQGSTSEDIEPYPSFTIGLTEKQMPVVQYLMQKTFREILQLAVSNLPALIDTNNANTERIKNIIHPSNFDDFLRDTSLARIYGQLRSQATVPGGSPSKSDGSTLQNIDTIPVDSPGNISPIDLVQYADPGSVINVEPTVQGSSNTAYETLEDTTQSTYNVLILGKTQVGKSSLVEYFRRDADPKHTIDQSRLGDGCFSSTGSVERFSIHTDLVPYEVVDIAKGKTHEIRNLGARIPREGKYHDLLKRREADHALRKVTQDAPPRFWQFSLVDTPGLNNTGGRSVDFAADIVREIISTRSFNLILIVMSAQSPLAMETRLELEYYAKVLQGLHSNIAFLYTHADYFDCHHSNIKHHSSISTRHAAYSKICRGVPNDTEDVELYKHFTIDLQQNKRPFIQGMIQNTLKDILQLAVSNPAALVDTSPANIDRIKAIPHPNRANQVSRGVLAAPPTAVAQAAAAPEEETEHDETEVTGDVSPAVFMASVFSNAEIEGFSCDFGMEVDDMDIN
ncbi:hypothetical protein BG000_011461 [Podila horticola]|nr:hypothetical protein BG000_011461 [Podila horticola]